MSVAQYERLKAAHEHQIDWRERVEAARESAAADLGGRSLPAVEDVVATMREERDGELLDLR